MFRFKQFDVVDDHCAMKVGTDGVLLGAWCTAGNARTVLDVGTGSGLIALMIAQRLPKAMITAVEIDAGSASDARQNFSLSPWHDRLALVQDDFLHLPQQRYDLIVSNPPFFSQSLLPSDAGRAQARHGASLPLSSLIGRAATMLEPKGRLALVTPTSCGTQVNEASAFASLNIARLTHVCTIEGKPPARILWELSLQPVRTVRDEIIVRDAAGEYTERYRQLCEVFYLHL